MKLTFLGTGTSQGVPVIGCRCRVCTSVDARDKRLRTSAMVELRGACDERDVRGLPGIGDEQDLQSVREEPGVGDGLNMQAVRDMPDVGDEQNMQSVQDMQAVRNMLGVVDQRDMQSVRDMPDVGDEQNMQSVQDLQSVREEPGVGDELNMQAVRDMPGVVDQRDMQSVRDMPSVGDEQDMWDVRGTRDERGLQDEQVVRLVIDAGPDFRCQMLRTGVRRLDAILLTHEHKDHIGGLDDVRAFNFVDYPPLVRKVAIYAAPRTAACVRKDFDYAFAQDKYRGVPEIVLHEIDPARPFRVGGVEIVPVSGHHSERFTVTGFRIGALGYLTDFKAIDPIEEEKLRGVDTLVVNALRQSGHPSHFSLPEALALIRRIRPRAAYITHMSHEMGLHADVERELPEGVHLACDRLEVTLGDD